MKNVWGILVRRLYAENRQFETVQDLRVAVQEAWNHVAGETREKLVESMPNRIFELISRKGGVTYY